MQAQTILVINWNLFWTIFNILVLFVLLRLFLFKPVQKMMQARQDKIKAAFDEAETKTAEAEAMKTAYANELEEAGKEAARILEDARNQARSESGQILEQAQAQADKTLADARITIAEEQEKARRASQKEIASLAILAAAKVMAQTPDSQPEETQIEDFIAKVGAEK